MSNYQGYNQTEYTGAGGFYNNGDSTSNNNNSNDGVSSSQSRTRQHLTPVTIKQIQESEQMVPDGPYNINNVELNLVSFVGIIRNVVDNGSNLMIQVEDGTGNFEFRKWHDETMTKDSMDEDGKENESGTGEFQIGKYVYVTGWLKDFNQKKNLQYPTIKKITDYNQVLYHFLSVVKVHVEAQGIKSGTPGAANGSSNGDALFASKPADEELDLSEKVFNFVKQHTPRMPDGVPLEFIKQKMNISLNQVMEQCQILEEKAKIYSGLDDQSYLAV